MNKPEPPQIFKKAERLVRRAADAGARGYDGALGAFRQAWDKATASETEAGHRRKVILFLSAGIAAIVAVLFVVSRLGGDDAAHAPVPTAQAVSVIPVETAQIAQHIALSGEARPVRDIQVAAPASGVRILEILVDEGEFVRQGQPMARLDASLAQAQIRAAQASVAEAEAAAVRARGEYARADAIRDSGALSTEAIEARRAGATAAEARLAAARAQLQEINARLGGGYVRAPAAGLVIDRTAEVGRNVDGQVLFRIAAGNQLEVSAQVAEADVLMLTAGQTAVFTLVDGSTVNATLRRGPASIDSRTRTGEALFALPQNTRVRAGMYLRGEAVLPERDAITAPQSSILYDNGQAYVYVADEQSRARRANVSLGVRDGDRVEILSGLEPGQRIIGAGAAFLQDGEQVRVLSNAPRARPSRDLRGRED